jgi:hypothetical protein
MNRTIAEPLTARSGIRIGRLVCVSDSGEALVSVAPDGSQPCLARSSVPLAVDQIGLEVVLAFEDGSPDAPIVLGVLERSGLAERPRSVEQLTARVDGTRVVLSATHEIVLECGDASITLTTAGKILIRGAYISTHSSGVQRIKGATVEIN